MWMMMINGGMRTEKREAGKVGIRKEHRECQKAKIQKSRDIQQKTNKCKPLRINSLIPLWGRMEKEDFHLLSSQCSFDISLSLSVSHILISLVSIHLAGA